MHKNLNEFEIRRDPTMDYGVGCLERLIESHILIMEKMASSHFLRYFHLILILLAGNEDMHKRLDEFEIRPDPTAGFHDNRKFYNLKNGVASFSRLFDNVLGSQKTS